MTAHEPLPVPSLVSGAMNFRDVGGLSAGSSRTRDGVLFRSGNLAAVDEPGRAAIGALGIRRIIDLRADDEVATAPSRIDGLDVVTQRVPLFLGSVASFFDDDLSLDDMYRRIVEDSAERVVDVVRGIVSDQPVLVHCTVGKDRTGVTVAFALAAAGADEQSVIDDYARTEAFLPPERNRAVIARLRRHYPTSLHVEDLATRSPARVMATLLGAAEASYGDVASYLLAHGLTDDELRELRRVLIL